MLLVIFGCDEYDVLFTIYMHIVDINVVQVQSWPALQLVLPHTWLLLLSKFTSLHTVCHAQPSITQKVRVCQRMLQQLLGFE